MEEELILLLAEFSSEQQLRSWNKLSGGHIHQTFRVQTLTSDLVFQELNPDIFPDLPGVMSNFQRIQKHLHEKDFPYLLPEFLSWPNGALIHYSPKGKPWRVMPFLSGYQVKEQTELVDDIKAAANVMGQLCRYLDDLSPQLMQEVIPGFFNATKWVDQFYNAWQQAPEYLRETCSHLYEELSTKSTYSKLPEVRSRVIHGDGKISNFMFDANREIAVILDWDTAMAGNILDEFGYLARSFISRKAEDDASTDSPFLNREFLEILHADFLETAGDCLSEIEQEQLLYGVKRTVWVQAIRFLADHLSGDTYYPVSRLNQNLDRAKNQFGLLLELEGMELLNTTAIPPFSNG
ncbi:MAG: aminoglycoside phosphotransferase family protein [Saprospiraceae bacterium]|nr:aminoglycoside phosphotransferase family protein [Saprospiraceae bacterium]